MYGDNGWSGFDSLGNIAGEEGEADYVFYDKIGEKSQGFDPATAQEGKTAYTKALNLLSNQDEYDFNLLLLPGLEQTDHSAVITKENTIFEKGVFTSCEIRENDKCPPWTIRAKSIEHNAAKKTIYYDYQIDFYKYSVYLFKQLKKNSELLINLKKIENLTKDKTLKNKVYFLIGQIHLNDNNNRCCYSNHSNNTVDVINSYRCRLWPKLPYSLREPDNPLSISVVLHHPIILCC